jgi:hypothetical protein
LQGANLAGAHLKGADLSFAEVYRTGVESADLSQSLIREPLTGKKVTEFTGLTWRPLDARPLTSDDTALWIAKATALAETPEEKNSIIARFDRLKPDFQTPAEDSIDFARWQGWAEASQALDPEGARYRRTVVTILGDLACADADPPFVVRPLVARRSVARRSVNRMDRAAPGDELETFRNRLKSGRKDPGSCPGVAGFTEDDWRQLDAIKPNAN